MSWDTTKGTSGHFGPISLLLKEVEVDSGHLLARGQAARDRPGQFQVPDVENRGYILRQIAEDRGRLAPKDVCFSVLIQDIIHDLMRAVFRVMPGDPAVCDFAVEMQSRTRALADKIMGEDLVAAVMFVNAVALGVPNEILIN